MKYCNCTFTQKTVGDGCEACNPQYWIDHLEGYVRELQEEKQALRQRLIDAVQFKLCSNGEPLHIDDLIELIENVFSEP